MIKKIVLLLLVFCGAVPLVAQSGPSDVILLLDTSASMSVSYREVNKYISGAFLKEFLREGDTFHLIMFSDNARLDIARRVEGRGDIETVIGRLFLQYPLDPWSDIPAALAYAEQYIAALPARPKKLVLVSDGNTIPAPGSSSQKLDLPALQSLIAEYKTRLGRQNGILEFILVKPGVALPSVPARPAAPPQPVQSAPVPVPPPPVQAVPPPAREPIAPPQQAQPSTEPLIETPLAETPPAPPPIVDEPQSAITQPAPPPKAAAQKPQRPSKPAPVKQQPKPAARPRSESRPSSADREGLQVALVTGLGILALCVAALIVFLVSRRLHTNPGRAISQAGSRRPEARYSPWQDSRTPQPPRHFDKNTPMLLNLFVEDQNTFIGKRNVHALKSGYTLTIGGGKSDFLIFLVPIPPHVGEVRRDEDRCTFIPRKPKYFPDLGSREVPDCVGKTIRLISDKNYELRFRLEYYEDPLEALNRTLNSLQMPGIDNKVV